jgi:hypothetical protein
LKTIELSISVFPFQANPACAVPNHLESVAAISCIESGYSKEMVQKAINTFIDRHGISLKLYSVRFKINVST